MTDIDLTADVDESQYDKRAFDAAKQTVKDTLTGGSIDPFLLIGKMRNTLSYHNVPDDQRSDLVVDAFRVVVGEELDDAAEDLRKVEWGSLDPAGSDDD